MKPFVKIFLLINLLFIGIVYSYSYPVIIDSTAFVTNEILFRPTDKSITIQVVPKKNLLIYFEYGIIPSVYPNKSEIKNSTANIPLRFVLLNLLPNTRYYYRMRYKESASSEYTIGQEHTFITQRVKGSAFKFTMTADCHIYDKKGVASVMNLTMQNQVSDNPDFIFDLGDTFGDDHNPTIITQQEMLQLHYNFLPYAGIACHSAPFFFCLGNHEGETGYDLLQTPPNNMAVFGTLARKTYYANPVPDGFYTGNTTSEQFGIGLPENYFAWEWGDALFVVLDAYRGYTADSKPGNWDWTLGKTQYDWFKLTLEKSSAKYKFVFIHHVLGQTRGAITSAKSFEWGGYETKNNTLTYTFPTKRPGWDLPIHQLMVKNKVNILFQGHDHLFAQEVLDGLIYQEVPMPSDSTYMIGMLANADAYVSNQLSGTGHLRVTVSPTNVKVDFVRAYLPKDTNATHRNGEVAFSYTVTSNSTKVDQESTIPTTIHLEQNYPNPFNPSTDIKYMVPEAGHVTLKVFNTLGNEAATLVDEFQQPGTYVSKFSAKSAKTGVSYLSSGIYFYQLRTNNTIITKKAILIK